MVQQEVVGMASHRLGRGIWRGLASRVRTAAQEGMKGAGPPRRARRAVPGTGPGAHPVPAAETAAQQRPGRRHFAQDAFLGPSGGGRMSATT